MTRDIHSVGILGAGTMGSGIAQIAAQHGWIVQLMDIDEAATHRALSDVRARFERLVEKGRMTADEAAAAGKRLHIATAHSNLSSCELLIEAIVEDMHIKTQVLEALVNDLPADVILATNTSSLSITGLSEQLAPSLRERIVGMHFFNPAPLMKLVEVIAGTHTDATVVARVTEIAESWGKIVAHANDVPGFIVNHVARPYYLEAFRIVEDGLAPPHIVDSTMKSLGGFRMGPFELTDLIGQDVNAATTRSVWEQLSRPPLLKPSELQESLVRDGALGRKAGRGIYDYSGDEPKLAIQFTAQEQHIDDRLREAAHNFAQRAGADAAAEASEPLHALVFARIIAALIVQAHLAEQRNVAKRSDIDIALKHGVNYPRGPFEWCDMVGTECVAALLDALNATMPDDRFATPRNLVEPSAANS